MKDGESLFPTLATPGETIALDRLPAGLRRLLKSLPERDWSRMRAFVIDCEEVGQLAETIPLASRAMEVCPPRMIARIRAKEISGQQVDEVYNAFHDAIHGVRQAVFRIFQLAALSPQRGPKGAPVEEPKSTKPEPPQALPSAKRPPAPPGAAPAPSAA